MANVMLALPADSWTMHGGGWWAPMMVGMALFWGAVLLGLVWLVRDGVGRRDRPEATALAILERRLAQGAVSLDEYEQRRAVVAGEPGPNRGIASHETERRKR